MSLEEAQHIFPVSFLQQLTNILINGNFGDFVMARDGLAIVKYFAESNPRMKIMISTNASAKPDIWEELGRIPNLVIGFAIDGLADTHILYRRNTNWQLVINNAKKFIAAGGHAVWRMIKFDHNQHQIELCKSMSERLGFSSFDLLEDGRTIGPVYNKKGDLTNSLGDDKHYNEEGGRVFYPSRVETWKEWSSPGGAPAGRLEQYKTIPIKQTVDCYSTKNKEIYITATGEVYPCCWLGFYPKQEYKHDWQADNMFLKDMAKNNNALDTSIQESIAWFNLIEDSWNKKAYTEGRLFKCDEYCGH
jgi:MoaA/NifB/PqqE/SkfB family radical SAM enzyme